jgi:hypothetical protein
MKAAYLSSHNIQNVQNTAHCIVQMQFNVCGEIKWEKILTNKFKDVSFAGRDFSLATDNQTSSFTELWI